MEANDFFGSFHQGAILKVDNGNLNWVRVILHTKFMHECTMYDFVSNCRGKVALIECRLF